MQRQRSQSWIGVMAGRGSGYVTVVNCRRYAASVIQHALICKQCEAIEQNGQGEGASGDDAIVRAQGMLMGGKPDQRIGV